MKKNIAIILVMFLGVSALFSQESLVDKNSVIFCLGLSYSNKGGDLYTDGMDNRLTTLQIKPTVDYFLFSNVFIGAGLNLIKQTQGNFDYSSTSIGPNVGYVFGNSDSKFLPFVTTKFRLLKLDDDSGTDFSLGGGLIIPCFKHIGFVCEGGFHWNSVDMGSETISTNTIGLGVGFCGFLF